MPPRHGDGTGINILGAECEESHAKELYAHFKAVDDGFIVTFIGSGLREEFCARDPAGVLAVLRTLRNAAALCAEPAHRGKLAALLARPGYLHLPEALIAASLAPDAGGPVFTQQYPDAGRAAWFAAQLSRWHLAPPGSLDGAASLYRPDLFLAAVGTAPAPLPEHFCDAHGK